MFLDQQASKTIGVSMFLEQKLQKASVFPKSFEKHMRCNVFEPKLQKTNVFKAVGPKSLKNNLFFNVFGSKASKTTHFQCFWTKPGNIEPCVRLGIYRSKRMSAISEDDRSVVDVSSLWGTKNLHKSTPKSLKCLPTSQT